MWHLSNDWLLDQVMVEAGSAVKAGDPLLVMIAMKMEYVIKVNQLFRTTYSIGDKFFI